MRLVAFCIINAIDVEKPINDNALVTELQLLADFHSMAVDFDSCLKEFPIFQFLKRFFQREEQRLRLQFRLNIS